ncbi:MULTISPECIES: hypothetical protein [unclassified Bradyrhizobium]|nr:MULTISPECIES: hypothetical protein [unclassified Bradyrhizobium]
MRHRRADPADDAAHHPRSVARATDLYLPFSKSRRIAASVNEA